MPSLPYTLFYFLVALLVLITFHEFGHYWVARRLGVKVLRFSVGFGSVLWRRQRSPESTEFVVSAIPLGGYVKMVDEREGEVAPADLPYAFNRQPVWKRSLIVAAGPVFNFLLAVLLYWAVLMLGESGLKPVLGPVPADTLSARAGFQEGDEILSVGGDTTPTWGLALTALIEKALVDENVILLVRRAAGVDQTITLNVPRELAEKPDKLRERLGFQPWQPDVPPVIGRIEPGSAAETAGLKSGDHLITMDGRPLGQWQQWVEYVRSKPGIPIELVLERDAVRSKLVVTPAAVDGPEGKVGRIGAAAQLPENLFEAMTVTYRLAPIPALAAAWDRTVNYSMLTLRIMGRMVVGRASVDNLSGPISIAQYAGQSAKLGLVQFFGFLASVSIGLAVLNMLPIPVLDGGHLLFYLIEGVKGRPLSDGTQAMFQQAGLFVLLMLIALAFYLDIERLLT